MVGLDGLCSGIGKRVFATSPPNIGPDAGNVTLAFKIRVKYRVKYAGIEFQQS